VYKDLYKSIIETAKKENRKKNVGIYYESHHIVPEFMFKNRKRTGPAGHLDGNPEAADNKVLLTFQEHLLAHYYLYEMYKDTRYGYSAGSALQFFFVKATGNHKRQIELSEVDEKFLKEMAHIRLLGIESIKKARSGKMPVVDATTKEKIGSVSVSHPKVLSGEWVHHTTGKKFFGKGRDQRGSNNLNFRPMSDEHKTRIYKCLKNSLVEDIYFSRKKFLKNLKLEFIDFKKISERWVYNNFKSPTGLVESYNKDNCSNIKYDPYYRSKEQRSLLAKASSNKRWVTNGKTDRQIPKAEMKNFLKKYNEYYKGRTNA